MSKPDPEAIARLREWLKPGDTLRTVLRHRSASGMTRTIDILKLEPDVRFLQPSHGRPITVTSASVRVVTLSYNAAMALGWPLDRARDGVKVSGAGMDMGFELVYSLSQVLFPDGFECIGDDCPSNDHSNGDRNYQPHHHKSGGYALKQEWL